MTNDTVVVADGVTSIFSGAAAMTVKLVGAAAILLMLDTRFALVFLLGGGLLLLVTVGFRKIMKRLHKRVQEADGKVRSYLQETVENLLVLKSFGGEETAEKKSQQCMAHHKKERLARNAFSNFCNLGFGAVMQGGYLFGLVWCGFGILHGTITYGTLTAVLSLVGQIQTPIANMTGYLPRFYAMLASAERLMELEALPEDQKGQPLSIAERNRLYEQMDSLDLEGINFSYPKTEEEVFSNAELSIAKGDFIAVTGESGIGKSTLLKLLLAVYEPKQGSMKFVCRDGAVCSVEPATRPMFAYVPQGNFLMSGSIRDSVTFGKDDHDSDTDRMEAVCRIACADAFIRELPHGYDSMLGEKGAGLSEGQLQRLAIARAIYSDAPILLLDECTSALDEQTEKCLLTNLRELTDKTVIIVTHRPAALAVCNKVVHAEEKTWKQEERNP